MSIEKFEVGMNVKVIAKTCGHGYEIGKVYTVGSVTSFGVAYMKRESGELYNSYITVSEVELASPPDPEEKIRDLEGKISELKTEIKLLRMQKKLEDLVGHGACNPKVVAIFSAAIKGLDRPPSRSQAKRMAITAIEAAKHI